MKKGDRVRVSDVAREVGVLAGKMYRDRIGTCTSDERPYQERDGFHLAPEASNSLIAVRWDGRKASMTVNVAYLEVVP